MKITKRVTIISYTVAFALIITMVTASVLLNNHEFILPEIAAMAIAMWAYRDPNWLRQPLKICLAPTLTSVIGFTINHLPLTYLCKVGLDLIFIMVCLRLIRSNFAPSLATGLLPLITNAHDWKLVLIIFTTTFILMLVIIMFKMHVSLDKEVKNHDKYTFIFLGLIFLWMGICWLTGFEQLAVIPPNIVVVYESIQKNEYSGKAALKQGVALTVSATVGTLLFLLIDSWVLITLLDMFFMLLLQWIINIRIPAIYAFPLLPFIFPIDVVLDLPLGTLLTCLFMFVSVLVYKKNDISARTKRTDVSM